MAPFFFDCNIAYLDARSYFQVPVLVSSQVKLFYRCQFVWIWVMSRTVFHIRGSQRNVKELVYFVSHWDRFSLRKLIISNAFKNIANANPFFFVFFKEGHEITTSAPRCLILLGFQLSSLRPQMRLCFPLGVTQDWSPGAGQKDTRKTKRIMVNKYLIGYKGCRRRGTRIIVRNGRRLVTSGMLSAQWSWSGPVAGQGLKKNNLRYSDIPHFNLPTTTAQYILTS